MASEITAEHFKEQEPNSFKPGALVSRCDTLFQDRTEVELSTRRPLISILFNNNKGCNLLGSLLMYLQKFYFKKYVFLIQVVGERSAVGGEVNKEKQGKGFGGENKTIKPGRRRETFKRASNSFWVRGAHTQTPGTLLPAPDFPVYSLARQVRKARTVRQYALPLDGHTPR